MATTTLKIYILKPLLIINTIFCINITAKNCYSLIKITVNTMTPIISLIDALAQVDSIINFNSMIYIYMVQQRRYNKMVWQGWFRTRKSAVNLHSRIFGTFSSESLTPTALA